MLPAAPARILLGPLRTVHRTASCLLALLALAAGCAFSTPAAGQPAAAAQPAAGPQPAVSIATPPGELGTAAPTPQATPAQSAADPVPPASAAPTPQPTADLQAASPPPDPARPAWAVSARETGLWSAPTEGNLYSKISQGSTLRILDSQAGRFRAFYPGDGARRQPGEVWVDAADLAAAAWPHWVRLRSPGTIVTRPSGDGVPLAGLAPGDFAEVVGEARGNWAHVYFLGDGRGPTVEGWLESGPTAPIPGKDVVSSFALSRDAIAAGGPDPWIKVPYRSQLDGSPYAAANCGPTALGMVLEGFGFKVSPPALRREILSLQPDEECDDCGVYLQNLAEVAASRGLKILSLRDDKPDSFHHWTGDEIRSQLRAGHPVIAQVFYRRLPARSDSAYWGDHFIVLTGLLGDRFVFNDPINVEGPGYSRLITPQALDLAMAESDYPYAAFAVSKQ